MTTNSSCLLTSKDIHVIADVMTSVWTSGGTMTKDEYRAYRRLIALDKQKGDSE